MRKLRTIEIERLSLDDYRNAPKLPLVVVLDDVRSLYNVGSIFRTSDAFRVSAICLCGITATPPHAEIHKTALGAEDSVDWEYFSTAQEAVDKLCKEGFSVYAVEQAEGSVMLDRFSVHDCESQGAQKKIAIVVGNEVKGVQQTVVDMCHGCLEIPQFGTKHSLNVSVAAALVIWHMAQQLQLPEAE